MQPHRKIWFPAKKYGWGWGPPCCWQGWVVLITWIAVMVIGVITIFRPDRNLVGFYLFEVVMISALMTICWLKGEKPKWRWGNK
jgi:hypothetical protein